MWVADRNANKDYFRCIKLRNLGWRFTRFQLRDFFGSKLWRKRVYIKNFVTSDLCSIKLDTSICDS
jgi:hypothetical protein